MTPAKGEGNLVSARAAAPSKLGVRPWRAKRPRRSSAANESLKRKTWDERMEERAKRKALIQTMKEIEDEKRREKEEERERIRLKRERKEANQKKQLMAKAQIVKNTSKIKKMNKKQLRSLRTADVS